jgi:MFS family permease
VSPRVSAVAVVFVANGLGGPSFLARLPERQSDLRLSDAGLGLVLVGLAAGALVASPLIGHLVAAAGSRRVASGAAVVLGASLWSTGAAPTGATLFGALALVGAADAAMDIAMNANGAAFEQRIGRSVMHRLHAAWSLGALTAGGVAGVAAATDVPLTAHLLAVGLVLALSTVAVRARLAPDVPAAGDLPAGAPGPAIDVPASAAGDPPEPAPAPAAPSGQRAGTRRRAGVSPLLMVLAAATVGGALVEGAPMDWAAVQLERYGTAPGASAAGVVAFMAGMVAGRLVGDPLTDRLGPAGLLRAGTALAAVGIGVGTLAGHPLVFTLGLALAGAGAAGFFPLAFSAAARVPGVAAGAGAATVSLAARLGFLAEPLLIGGVAELVSLRWAFGIVACVAATMALAARRIVPATTSLSAVTTGDVRLP